MLHMLVGMKNSRESRQGIISNGYRILKINSEINVLGSLPDFNLISVFLKNSLVALQKSGLHSYTSIKTDKSVKRFERAITNTLIKFHNRDIEALFFNALSCEYISPDTLLLLFWNASFNNELLNYLNDHVYFTSFYSGRVTIRQGEVIACIKDLRERETELQRWAATTLETTASKYLTLLKKLNLLEGSRNKSIVHPYLNDKMFLHFVYWVSAIEAKPNLLESKWLKYSFSERGVFIERLMQKKFSKYVQLIYTGDKLTIEPLIPYSTLYDALK
jgi:hypothetical protein